MTAIHSGGISSISDLLLTSPNAIAKQCHLSPLEIKGIIASVCKEQYRQVRQLDDVEHEGDEVFTTGDSRLDDVLGGGIRTGMIWEIVGERYGSLYCISTLSSLKIARRDQRCRQDSARSPALFVRTDPSITRWHLRFDVLFGHLFHATHLTPRSNLRVASVVIARNMQLE
jgi:predicted ATP-dependent serine protease